MKVSYHLWLILISLGFLYLGEAVRRSPAPLPLLEEPLCVYCELSYNTNKG